MFLSKLCLQVVEILRKESEWKLMSGHVDEFIIAALMQLGLQASRRMGSDGTACVEKLYTSVITSLTTVSMSCFPFFHLVTSLLAPKL